MKIKDLRKELIDERVCYVFYKAAQLKWNDEPNPEYNDVEYFLDKDDAIKYAKKIKCEVGFQQIVQKLYVKILTLDFEDDEEFELEDLDNYRLYYTERDEIWTGTFNDGRNLEGAIILVWSWGKYVGYSRHFDSIRYGFYDEKETDLIDNTKNTFKRTETVLLEKEEIEDLLDSEILEKVIEELRKLNKWDTLENWNEDKIIHGLGLEIEIEEED
jgi:hypothetical protein